MENQIAGSIGNQSHSPPRGRWWPGILVAAIGVGAIVFFQAVTIIDRGHSNAFTAIAFGVLLLGLGLWVLLLAPISRQAKWWAIAVPSAIIGVLFAVLRIDDTDSQLHPRFVWRWSKTADERLAEQDLTATAGTAELATSEYDFPGFLGANRDAYVPNVRLATDWDARPPKLLWKQPIGAGHSGFAVVGDSAFTLEQRGEEELVTCYDTRSGKLRWFHAVEARHRNRIGGDGPSSTPEVRDGRVYALGGTGVLRCLDAASGKEIWIRDVLADVGTNYETDSTFVNWGRAASPLVLDELVVVPGGGPVGKQKSLVAYDRASGEIVWTGGNRQVSYSSPSMASYGGVPQIVIVNEESISAHDPTSGKVLWGTRWDGGSSAAASASQTVPIGDMEFFVSKGYSMGGAAVFELSRDEAGDWSAKRKWHKRRVLMTKLNNVVVADGFAYGPSDGVLQCVDLDGGKLRWEGGESAMQVLRVGDVLLVMGEWGQVSLVALDPEEYRELARFQAIAGKTWNNPAVAGKLLLVRNGEEAACYELPLAGGETADER